MTKRMTYMTTALVIVFGSIIAFNSLKTWLIKRWFAHYVPPPVSVSAVTVQQQNWEPKIAAVGNFTAINGVDVNAQASGNVTKIHFESGQYLEKGMPLLNIDDSTDQAALKSNQAELVLRKLNYQRQIDLFRRGATSSSSVDEANANLQQAQANVEKTEAQIRQKHLVAPFSGRLGIRQVNLGQYIMPGQTTIVTLQSLDPLYLEFYLPEHLLPKLQINQAIQFSVEEFPKVLFTGTISAINAKVDTNTHNILVQATLPNCPADAIRHRESTLIKIMQHHDKEKVLIQCDSRANEKNHITNFAFIPGMFAALEVEQPTLKDIIAIPSTAISYSLYGNSVFVIEQDKSGKKNKEGEAILRTKRVFVNTGEQQGNYTLIEKGIHPGQQIVSSGELKLQNGATVTINNTVQLADSKDLNQLGQ